MADKKGDDPGEFTFRADVVSTQGPSDDMEQLMNAWDSPMLPGAQTPETTTVADTSSMAASDDERVTSTYHAASRQASASHHHYHYHHHYYYHVAKYAPRRRLPQQGMASGVGLDTTGSEQTNSETGETSLGLEQDPLTLWHTANQARNSLGTTAAATEGTGPDGANSTWMAEILSAHGIGQEWAAVESPSSEAARRWTHRHATLDSSQDPEDDDEFSRWNPHWEDMITFRQSRVRVPRERAWSASSDTASQIHAAANQPSRNKKQRLLAMATNTVGRTLCLTVLPVVAVLLWCAVPLKTDIVRVGPVEEERLNFWFFLFFYYGIYNAVALALVTQIFHVYSLTWWPRSMSGVLANVISWLFTTFLGALVYLCNTGIERDPMTWASLTLLTLLLPVIISFAIIQRHYRRSKRLRRWGTPTPVFDAIDDEQRPLMATSVEWRTPASYRRFLWFCASFLLWYAALVAGELLAYIYIETLPHKTRDEFFYVYSWIAIVNILSLAAGWVINAKIRSWPLQYIYTLYFFTTYFIFYRNLFARLENPEQVVYLQMGASLWVVVIYPLRMARWVYRILAFICRWGEDYPYDAYARQLGRAFFLRNKAENATILGFLCWVTILHFGPNRRHYPYFRFEQTDTQFNYEYGLTVRASAYAWASEFVASRIVRYIFRCFYGRNISSEAVYDFRRYPHVVSAMVLVTIHVLQNILFGMIHLNFS